jgi:glycosyltransferase involved in cell wall biosynthesis
MRPEIALVHHWLVTMRGGEQTFEAIAELFPSADIFTLVCDRAAISDSLKTRNIQSSLLQRFPRAQRWYPYYLPFFPFATRRLDLTGYDLIVSSDAATVKGVRGGQATHVCYCHTPMRYVWQSYQIYRRAAGTIGRHALGALRKRLCQWDYEAAQRVTHFVANSRNVQKRIKECYGRESCVIYPPVDTQRFSIGPIDQRADAPFLVVSQLVPYKRVDLLVDAFNKCRRPLTVIGDGSERRRLEHLAGPNIRFLGPQSNTAVVRAMQECKAFVFAGEEDFGIVMAEAQACGKPVIALARGGATEIVEPDVTGVLFEEESAESLIGALDQFDKASFNPHVIRAAAMMFGRDRFLREFSDFIAERTEFRCCVNFPSLEEGRPRRSNNVTLPPAIGAAGGGHKN